MVVQIGCSNETSGLWRDTSFKDSGDSRVISFLMNKELHILTNVRTMQSPRPVPPCLRIGRYFRKNQDNVFTLYICIDYINFLIPLDIHFAMFNIIVKITYSIR